MSERVQERDLLWRWLLDRSERTVDDVAYRYGELWLKQLRLDAGSAPVLEGQLKIQRKHLEQRCLSTNQCDRWMAVRTRRSSS